MEQNQFPQVLKEMAFLCELKGENPFKIRALENSARVLSDLNKDLRELFETGEITKIPGVGKGTQAMAKEFLEKGKVKEHEDLKKEFPETIFEILEVQGLGPKKCKALYEQLQIASLVELEYACQENRLLDLKGFGEKTQKNILQSINQIKSNRGKVILPIAIFEAEECKELWKDFPGVEKFSEVGELRRKMEILTELEFLLSGDVKKIEKACEKKWKRNEKGFFFSTKRGMRVQVYLCEIERFSEELVRLTGPSSFVARLQLSKARSEEDIFQKNKIDFLPPECRDFPSGARALIEEKNIRGIFHFHTTWSDGSNSLEEMVQAALEKGWEYLGVSEHSQSAFYANGLKEERVLQQKKEIENLQKKYSIRIFHGIESDILPNGELDYSEKFLNNFDFVIASVHGQFKLAPKEQTKRLCRALQNPATSWLGHWTGRLLLGRAGYEFDKDEVLKVAAAEGRGIELNSNPYRLDVDWRDLPRVVELGISVGIFPDAHSVGGLDDYVYGVTMARKAGLSSANVTNTKNLKEMEAWLKK